ncbi:hypothetical protein CI238_07276, partial [Colletotrichum incanum]
LPFPIFITPPGQLQLNRGHEGLQHHRRPLARRHPGFGPQLPARVRVHPEVVQELQPQRRKYTLDHRPRHCQHMGAHCGVQGQCRQEDSHQAQPGKLPWQLRRQPRLGQVRRLRLQGLQAQEDRSRSHGVPVLLQEKEAPRQRDQSLRGHLGLRWCHWLLPG